MDAAAQWENYLTHVTTLKDQMGTGDPQVTEGGNPPPLLRPLQSLTTYSLSTVARTWSNSLLPLYSLAPLPYPSQPL